MQDLHLRILVHELLTAAQIQIFTFHVIIQVRLLGASKFESNFLTVCWRSLRFWLSDGSFFWHRFTGVLLH